MFYRVGSVLDYSFIYDTDDGSYEIVKNSSLMGVGFEEYTSEYMSLHKLCTLCDLPSFNRYISTVLSYETYDCISVRPARKVSMLQVVDLFVFRRKYIIGGSLKSYGNSDYIVAIRVQHTPKVKGMKTVIVGTDYDSIKDNIGWVLSIPDIMLFWLLKIKSEERLDLYKSAIYDFVVKYYFPDSYVSGAISFYSDVWKVC